MATRQILGTHTFRHKKKEIYVVVVHKYPFTDSEEIRDAKAEAILKDVVKTTNDFTLEDVIE